VTEAPIQITAIGTVQAIAVAMIKSRMDGEITQVNFEEGQEVKEGDLLFTLDDRVARAQLQQAEATLERDKAQLERFRLEVTRQSGLATRGVATAQKLEDTMRPPSKPRASTWPSRSSRHRSSAAPARSPSSAAMSSRPSIRRRWSRRSLPSRSCARSTSSSRCPNAISPISALPRPPAACR
jgi:multidrug resistance efflux pump